MKKVTNFFFLLIFIIFFSITFKYYSSNKNIEAKNHNRKNINKIINTKILNLPILKNDTDNIIKFNDVFLNNSKDDKPRGFWNLIRSK